MVLLLILTKPENAEKQKFISDKLKAKNDKKIHYLHRIAKISEREKERTIARENEIMKNAISEN